MRHVNLLKDAVLVEKNALFNILANSIKDVDAEHGFHYRDLPSAVLQKVIEESLLCSKQRKLSNSNDCGLF